MNYLFFAYGFVCLVLTVNGDTKKVHSVARQKCYADIGLAKDEISASTFQDNPKSGCFFKCFLENLDLIKEDGSINAVASVELIQEEIREQARPLVDKCVGESANIAEGCEKSLAAFKCLHQANPQIFVALDVLEPPKAA